MSARRRYKRRLNKLPFIPKQSSNNNYLINPDFDIWVRGTSFISVAGGGTYGVDRFRYFKLASGAVHDISRSTDIPTLTESRHLSNYSVLIDCTTADATVAAGDLVIYGQPIEGYNFKDLAQSTMMLSFWVKATKTGIYCVSLQDSTGSRSFVSEYTINITDTWEKKEIPILATPSAGTWDYTNGLGLDVLWTLMSGTTYQTTANIWQTGNFLGTSNQVNACDSVSNDFRLAQVKLEKGTVATPFISRLYPSELSLCQRYYELSQHSPIWTGDITTGNNYHHNGFFAVSKRITPIMTYTHAAASGFNSSAPVANSASLDGFDVFKASTGTQARGFFTWSWVANAEI